MIRQCVKDKIVEIISSEDMGGLPMVGENDAGIMRLYDKDEMLSMNIGSRLQKKIL